ncbi:MAG: hypothetical protein COU31_01470 [Candidatus Magasanikbacteria bacterium CG10_big_fil_rev_8_21_14_0_10_40_10]|uniref:Pyruvate/ketoisovalerate oxidoreductase catalytic domain-containing protein n=1 Tax=Candidatus Magasanikbacteria bacterium CG10_big_fil_rev_8_21_14_0_10_40_10 TaxID=1974648 RepID=A0A2M6W4P5_9BACT|nr:MAG: hypothetical protein COU31_01470 [Candidatus Magasanikbacteria bacterium CG10_big_fil_rev_8_21_14_0_10_40_10]
MNIKLLLAGDGGQGIQTISSLIARSAFDNDFYVSQIPNFGLEQRGGVSLEFVQIADEPITYPKFARPDIFLIMSEQARERTVHYYDLTRVQAGNLKVLDSKDFQADFEKNQIKSQSQNIFFLGVICKLLSDKKILSKDDMYGRLEKKLGQKTGWEENAKSFTTGYNYINF